MKEITIIIADDHQLVRESIAALFEGDDRFKILADCENGLELSELCKKLKPDVVLVDINMPEMDGYQATLAIRASSPETRIVCVTMHTNPFVAQRMLQAGVSGYVTKQSSYLTLVKAVLDVYAGHKFLCAEASGAWSESVQDGLNCLTKRELTIVSFIKDGFSSKDISSELALSPKTVEVHRYNILKKLKLPNTASLVNYVNRHGLMFQ